MRIDPRTLKAMQMAAEEIQKEYHRRKGTSYQSFDQVPFYHECYNIKPDLTTAQKMRVTTFLFNVETAKEL